MPEALEGTKMTRAYTYILECSDGSYYTGSTIDLETRIKQHQDGKGANHTKKRLPVTLVYAEEFIRIDDAFYREKQIQGWSRKKKEALIENNFDSLPKLSMAYRDKVSSRASDTKKKTFKSNGKLLLTGEYVVLDGAVALAIPTKYGQSLSVEAIESEHINWKSFDHKKDIWFESRFDLNNFEILKQAQNDNVSERLYQILKAARTLNSNFLKTKHGFKIETHLDFPKNWGLGTSSTLINNVAQWGNVDAFQLLNQTFGGSGYDIACAQHDTPITYQLNEEKPIVTPIDFNPTFKNHLYFVFLNKKQNSREGIAHYKSLKTDLTPIISNINRITEEMISCKNLKQFQELITTHESVIASLTKQNTVKSRLFNDFDGAIKSLGAWGGDFILACSETNPTTYFRERGFDTVIPYSDIILK